jgi:hypothetical protein
MKAVHRPRSGTHARVQCRLPRRDERSSMARPDCRHAPRLCRGYRSIRPIAATPDQVAAAETRERCHSPETFHGDKVRRRPARRRRTEYGVGDDAGAPCGRGTAGSARGIHWHRDPATSSTTGHRSRTPDHPYVRSGIARKCQEFVADGVRAEDYATAPAGAWIAPTATTAGHPIAATPERAVNDALAQGDHRGLRSSGARPSMRWRRYPSEDAGVRDITRAQDVSAAAGRRRAAARRRCDGDSGTIGECLSRDGGAVRRTRATSGIRFGGCFRCHDGSHKIGDSARSAGTARSVTVSSSAPSFLVLGRGTALTGTRLQGG